MKKNRILLKLSGEALSGEKGFGIDKDMMDNISNQIKSVHGLGIQIGIVIGGGNYFRGRTSEGMPRAKADYIGMLATVMNSLHLQGALEEKGINTRVQSSIRMEPICEFYDRDRAISYLEQNFIVIFASGTGSPFFSTDTAAALKACEIDADILLSAKSVDAVYDFDPKTNPNAKKYDTLSYDKILSDHLNVLDMSAAALCMDNNIPTVVFSLKNPDNILEVINGKQIGTYIS